MKYDELERLVVYCLELRSENRKNASAYVKAAGVPKAAEYAAYSLWIAGVSFEENEKTEELRRQLVHLKSNGYFDLDEE